MCTHTHTQTDTQTHENDWKENNFDVSWRTHMTLEMKLMLPLPYLDGCDYSQYEVEWQDNSARPQQKYLQIKNSEK